MKLETMIRKLILCNPSVIFSRLKALDAIYCICGNGFEWENGKIICPKNLNISKARRDLREWRLERGNKEEMKTIEQELDAMYSYVDENIDALCQNTDIDFVPPWGIATKKRSFYPISKDGRLNCPPDAKADWKAGALETCNLILSLPSNTERRRDNKIIAREILGLPPVEEQECIEEMDIEKLRERYRFALEVLNDWRNFALLNPRDILYPSNT